MQLQEVSAALQQMLEPTKRVSPNIGLSYDGEQWLELLPRVECADGFAMSVQASHTHYCSPRDSRGPWSSVEVGYPSAKVDGFMPYIDGDESAPTDTVYGYVPIDIVAQAIVDHGGFKTEAA